MSRTTLRTFLFAAALTALLAGCGGDNPAGPGDNGPGPGLQLEDFQAAAHVIGQLNMTSGLSDAGGTVNAVGLNVPAGAGSAAGAYYVADGDNNRVLGFDGVPAADGAAASFVIGQTDLTSRVNATTDHNLFGPHSCLVANGKLFVADLGNNRVLIWNGLPTGNVPADVVVGQPDFGSSGVATTRTGMFAPLNVAVGGGRLLVTDSENHRVLIWNAIPTTNGAPADVVLGQADFTTAAPTASASGLNRPIGIWTDGTRLAVGDADNHRVLIWNAIPTVNGAPADLVLGPADFDAPGPQTPSATSVGFPGGLTSDGAGLYVTDFRNHRVLVFTPFPTSNGVAASVVLGQSDFVHGMPNDANQDGQVDPNPTARTLQSPQGVTVIGDELLVADTANHRILVFAGGAR